MSQEPMEKVDEDSRKWLQDRCIELELENAELRVAARFVVDLYDEAARSLPNNPIGGYTSAHREWVEKLRRIITN